MADTETIGATLVALKKRAKMSLTEIAKAAGYAGRSSVQDYFNADYDKPRLPYDIAQKLAEALSGKGEPPIRRTEVTSLAGAEAGITLAPENERALELAVVYVAHKFGVRVGRDDPQVARAAKALRVLLALEADPRERDRLFLEWIEDQEPQTQA